MPLFEYWECYCWKLETSGNTSSSNIAVILWQQAADAQHKMDSSSTELEMSFYRLVKDHIATLGLLKKDTFTITPNTCMTRQWMPYTWPRGWNVLMEGTSSSGVLRYRNESWTSLFFLSLSVTDEGDYPHSPKAETHGRNLPFYRRSYKNKSSHKCMWSPKLRREVHIDFSQSKHT